MRRIFILFIALTFSLSVFSQKTEVMEIDLERVLTLAAENSLDVKKVKNNYLSKYWEYENYKAERLPTININFDPLGFQNRNTEVYNYDENRNEYRSIKTLTSSAGISFSQPILATGGSLFLNSNVNRLESFGENPNLNFNNNIFRIGFEQKLFDFNSYKWDKKIEPLKYQLAKKNFITSKQLLHIKTVGLFFGLVGAQLNLEMANDNFNNADKLYKLGLERFKLATINKEQLLNLEHSFLASEIALRKAEGNLNNAQFKLYSFLSIDESVKMKFIISKEIPNLNIQADKVVGQAFENNAQILQLKLSELQSLREVNKTKAAKKFRPTINGSIGLNKSSNSWPDTFKHPLEQQSISIGVDIPIVDWGRRRRNNLKAEKQHEITLIEKKQQEIDFKQEVRLLVFDFNIQYQLVQNAFKVSEVAKEVHSMVMQRFMFGTADYLKLNNAVTNKDNAHSTYIQSLKNYWEYYYTLQMLSLTDLNTGGKLTEQFDIKSLLQTDR